MLVIHRFVILVICLWLVACQSRPKVAAVFSKSIPVAAGAASTYVQVRGTQLFKADRPYYAVGANVDAETLTRGTAELGRELDVLKASGVNSLRVILTTDSGAVTESEQAPVVTAYDSELLNNLDALLNEVGKRDMTVVLVLSLPGRWWLPDELGSSEKVPVSEAPSWSTARLPLPNSAEFYRSESAQAFYQELIRGLITRVNTVTQKAYVDDPSILAWQLPSTLSSSNEVNDQVPGYGRERFAFYKSWLENSANFIKSLDSQHLVSVANDGAISTMQDIDVYRDTQAIGSVDYVTVHLWPKTWGWVDNSECGGRTMQARSKAYLLQHLLAAKALDKPLILEEFGFDRDAKDAEGITQRDLFYAEIFAFIEQQAELGEPIAGSNFWVWGGKRHTTATVLSDLGLSIGERVASGVGDDHRFSNSVFDEDQSTLNKIASHAQVMGKM